MGVLEKPPVAQLLENYIIFYGTWRFIAVRNHKSSPLVPNLSQINLLHNATTISLRPISVLSSHLRFGLPRGLVPSGFPTKTLYAYHMPRPSHPPCLDDSNYIWRRVQDIEFLLTQFSPTSYYFITRRFTYSSQRPVLKYRQSMVFS
jgi:hypothetical protein